ncbi:hypothetical protein C0J52_23551 [Blattella germanica]|nr:hypothetical protein C0J52_23551 [Blattella germanica]
MPSFVFTLQHRVFMYDNYMKIASCREIVRRFRAQLPSLNSPSEDTVRRLVNKFRETGSVLDKKQRATYCVLTADKLDKVRETLERMPTKFLRRLAQETGISKSTTWRGMKQLHMKPYKIMTMHDLWPHDHEMRLWFCNWMLNINDGIIDP